MRRVLLAALVAVVTTLVGAAAADAGGPTSVLLTNPGGSRAAALYYTDVRYGELEELLHDAGSVTGDPGDGPSRAGATYLNVTWLVHDVIVWRTDMVLLDRSGGAWIATSTETFGEESASDEPIWSRLADPDRVRELAASLDLIGAGPVPNEPGGDAAAAMAPEATSEVSPPPAPVVTEATRWFTLTGWRWAVPGLLLGLAAAFLVRGRRAGSAAPRQELIDGRPERVTAPG